MAREVRWKTSDRGLRYYHEVDGHSVHESSLATEACLYINGTIYSVGEAAKIRDRLPEGLWRETLSAAIKGHYQLRQADPNWAAGSPCNMCGSTDTTLENDKAACNTCGVSE